MTESGDRRRTYWLGPGRRRRRRDDRRIAALVRHHLCRVYRRESQRRPGIALRTHGGIWLAVGGPPPAGLGIGLGG